MFLCKAQSLLLVFLVVLTVQLVQMARGFEELGQFTAGKHSSTHASLVKAQPKSEFATRRNTQERLSHHNARLNRSLLKTEQPLTPFASPIARIDFAHLESPFSVFLDGNMRPPCAAARV
ncbi:MAG: hypothetical protein ACXWP1_12655, partial [Bdellovibrionota bacterium]